MHQIGCSSKVTFWIVVQTLAFVDTMPVTIRACSDLQPLYFLNHVIPNRYKLPRGISIIYDEKHSIHAYELGEHAGSLKFPASELFTRCSYWPEEYSILATFKLSPDSDIPTWENGYLFSLIPENSAQLKLGVSISREQVTLFYSDFKIQPGRKALSFDYKLYDNEWHTIIITVAGNIVGLRVDCKDTITKTFERTYPAFLDTMGDNIHVGNRKIQPGQFRGVLKQLLVLPGADAGQLACPAKMPGLPSLSQQPTLEMVAVADSPYNTIYQIPYDAECSWKETGKIWYDIYTLQLKVCFSGTWKSTNPTQPDSDLRIPAPKLDYFMDYKRITTPAPAIDIYVFEIPDEGIFVAFANYQDDGPRKQKSALYEWRNESLHLVQNITACKPTSWTSFKIGKHFFLAVANLEKQSARSMTESVTVFKWQSSKKRFRHFQEIPCTLPRDVEAFEIDGEHYLVMANSHAKVDNNDEISSESFIWKFEEDLNYFKEYQKITTTGAWDWTYFKMLSDAGVVFHFLVVANTIDGKSVHLQSELFYWSKDESQTHGSFVYYQPFETSGATDFEYFEIDGNSYLAVANSVSSLMSNVSLEQKYSSKSVIYKANRAKQNFEVFQEISTFGILDWEFFTIGNDSYLIGSNQQPVQKSDRSLSEQYRNTIIYRWQGAEKFVAAHKIQTSPSADWETIKDGKNTYLLYANGSGRVTEIYKAKLR